MFGGEAGDQFFCLTVASRTPFCWSTDPRRQSRGAEKPNITFYPENEPTLSLQPNKRLINQPGNTTQCQKFNICFLTTLLSVLHSIWERIKNEIYRIPKKAFVKFRSPLLAGQQLSAHPGFCERERTAWQSSALASFSAPNP